MKLVHLPSNLQEILQRSNAPALLKPKTDHSNDIKYR